MTINLLVSRLKALKLRAGWEEFDHLECMTSAEPQASVLLVSKFRELVSFNMISRQNGGVLRCQAWVVLRELFFDLALQLIKVLQFNTLLNHCIVRGINPTMNRQNIKKMSPALNASLNLPAIAVRVFCS